MSKPFPTLEQAKQHAQEQANLTSERWVWYTAKDGAHRAEKAAVYQYVELDGVSLEGDMVITQRRGGPQQHIAYPQDLTPVEKPEGPIWRCTWCCKDTSANPCEHCESTHTITDRTKPHRPEWSRHTMREVECKVCDRRGPYSIQQESAWCDERNNPAITGIHEEEKKETTHTIPTQ